LKNKYEEMRMFDPAVATDWDKIKAEVDRLMERAEATVLACGKWDERRLAYEIRGVKRAVYVLTYFEADPGKIAALERDAELSESIVRYLVVRADHVTEEKMKEAVTFGAGSEMEGPPRRREESEGPTESRPAREQVATATAEEERGAAEDEA